MKRLLFVFSLAIACVLTGCGIPGSPNKPDDSVTLKGVIYAPKVAANGILASVGEANDEDTFARFMASSTCKVNGVEVQFNISSDTRELVIEKIPPMSSYNLWLSCGDLTLAAFARHIGRHNKLPIGLSLKSTAEWSLRNRIATLEGMATDQLQNYDISPAMVNSLAGKMQAELEKNDQTAANFKAAAAAAIDKTLEAGTLADWLVLKSGSITSKKEYSATVTYIVFDAQGQPALAVQGVATFVPDKTGRTSVVGNMSLKPTGVTFLAKNPEVSELSEVAFTFMGSLNGQFLTFTRKGTLGPLQGKELDSWVVFPVRDGLAFKAKNLDKHYYSGLETRSADFILK